MLIVQASKTGGLQFLMKGTNRKILIAVLFH